MRQAVTRQGISDNTKGILLSGGLDSRLILGYLCQEFNPRLIHSFTFGIPNSDDACLANKVATQVGTLHHFYELKPDYLITAAAEGVKLTDGMMSCVHMHAYANLRAQTEYAQIIYKGYMGDALLGGHLDHQLWADYNDETYIKLLFDDVCVLFRPEEQKRLFSDHYYTHVKDALAESFKETAIESQAKLIANRQNHFDLRQRQRRFILNGVELVRSYAVVRTPFCDNDLVDFMLSVPPGFRLDRMLMVQAFIRYFPDLAKIPFTRTGFPLMSGANDLMIRFNQFARYHLSRIGIIRNPFPKRRPYADYAHWMRTALRDWVEGTLLSSDSLDRGYFNSSYIRNLVSEHMAGSDHTMKIGMLLAIELWHKQFSD
jgi:asparagine synthase (glutamine-hydrolysing)